MTDTEAAMKMMSEGFALLAKGFAAVVADLDGAERHGGRTRTDDGDTRTCTLPEAGKRLGCSRATISRLCEAGELQYTKDPKSGYRRVVVKSIADHYHRYLQAA